MTTTVRPAGGKKRAALLVLTPSFIKQLKEHLLFCVPGIMLDAFRRFTEQWVTRHGNQCTELSSSGKGPGGLDSPPAVRVDSRTRWERRSGPRGSATGSQGWIMEGLGSHTTGLTSRFSERQQEMTKVFFQHSVAIWRSIGHFREAAGEQSLQPR